MEKVYKFIENLGLEETKKLELIGLIERSLANIEKPLLLTVEQAAAYIGIGTAALRRESRKRHFPKVYNGNKVMVIRNKIENWLEKVEGTNIGN